MSEDKDDNPLAGYLIKTRELVASGQSVYGPPDSPAAKAKLEELNARIELGRELGEIPAEPAPWAQRVREERLAQEFPLGDPSASGFNELLTDHMNTRFDQLDELSPKDFIRRADEVAKDFKDRPSQVSFRHGSYRPATGDYPSGHAIVEALVADAEPAINAIAEPEARADMLKLIRGDRKLLELLAARGAAMTRYAAARAKYKLP